MVTFFTMGGFLLTHNMLFNLQKKKYRTFKDYLMIYVHRYIRLTVPLIVAILIQGFLMWAILESLQSSNFRVPEVAKQVLDISNTMHEQCKNCWYKNILYIFNFETGWNRCIDLSWYISVDMQCFIIATPFVWLLHQYPKLGLFSVIKMIIFCTQMVLMIQPRNNEEAQAIDLYIYKNMTLLRVIPYMIGLLGAYYYFVYGKHLQTKIRKLALWAKILAGLPVWILTFYIQYEMLKLNWLSKEGILSASNHVFINTFWALSSVAQVFLCELGLGGPINSFLSWNLWTVIARICYCSYLMQFAVRFPYRDSWMKIDFSLVEFIEYTYGFLILAFSVGASVHLLVEQPVTAVKKYVIFQWTLRCTVKNNIYG